MQSIVLAAFFAALFYGLFLVTLTLYLQSLARVRTLPLPWATRTSRMARLLPIICVILAVVATVEVTSSLLYAVYIFAYHDGAQTVGAKQSIYDKIFEMFLLCDVFITLAIADTILIYRCYKVYGSSWRLIILPACTAAAGAVAFCVLVRLKIPARDYRAGDPPGTLQAGIVAWSSTICTNLITTGLLVRKIRQGITYAAGISTSAKSLNKVSNVLIESGMLSAAFTVASAVAHGLAPVYGRVFSTSQVQIVAISFTLIAYRVNKERIGDQASSLARSAPVPHSIRFRTTTILTTLDIAARDVEMGTPHPALDDDGQGKGGSEANGASAVKC